MITIKRLRTGKWEGLAQVGGLVPMRQSFKSEATAREWAAKTDRELRTIRNHLLTIAMGNRGKPKARKERPPEAMRGLITPAIESFLRIYGCDGQLPLEQRAPQHRWTN